jgi:2-methylisocitrate lyase-like PEP mutase family enzyme
LIDRYFLWLFESGDDRNFYELFSELRHTGTQKHMVDRMYTRKQLYELLDYNGMLELEAKFAGKVLDK